MVITSFYLLNMFPQMRTSSSSPNNQHPTPKPNMFPQMRTLHHHRTINTQHPDKTYSLRYALYIITEQSTLNTQAKHVPSDAHFTSSPNNQHPTAKPNMFPQMRTLHHHLTVNTQQPWPWFNRFLHQTRLLIVLLEAVEVLALERFHRWRAWHVSHPLFPQQLEIYHWKICSD